MTVADEHDHGSPHRVRLHPTPLAVAGVVFAVAAALVLWAAFSASRRTLGWMIACSIVAMLVSPVVDRLQRKMPRWLVVVLTMAALGIGGAGLWIGMLVGLGDAVDRLQENAPVAAAGLEERSDVFAELELTRRVEDFVEVVDQRLGSTTREETVGSFPTYFVTGILMLFILGYGPAVVDAFFIHFVPGARRARWRAILDGGVDRGRNYLLFAAGQAAAVTLIMGLLFEALDLPASLALGAIVGFCSAIPYFGIVLGGVPAVLVAAGIEGYPAGLIALGFVFGLQLIEITVVRRRLDPATVRVGPALMLIVALIGWELYALGGALYGGAILVLLLAWFDVATGAVPPDVTPVDSS